MSPKEAILKNKNTPNKVKDLINLDLSDYKIYESFYNSFNLDFKKLNLIPKHYSQEESPQQITEKLERINNETNQMILNFIRDYKICLEMGLINSFLFN